MAAASIDADTMDEQDELNSKIPEFPPEEENELSPSDRVRTIIAFVGVGFLLHCLFSIIISGSEDILAGTVIPTTVVVIAHVGPMTLVNYSCPWFMQKLSYFIRVFIVFGFMAGGLLVIVFVEQPYFKIAGVSLNAVAHALGEITFLALGAFYGEVAVTSFAAGSGAGILIGPVYYLGLTSWACMSPQKSMIVASGFSILLLLFYYILNKDRIKSHAIAATYRSSLKDSAKYQSVATTDTIKRKDPWSLSCSEKFQAAGTILPLMLALCISYASQYLTIQAVFTTISFPSSPFPPRDHYVYYVALNGVGEFLSRSYLAVVGCYRPALARKLVIKRTWVLALCLLGVFSLALCASWYRFFQSVAFVLALSFVVGAISGTVFANTLMAIREIVEPRHQEFCLGLVTAGETSGALLGSFIGLKLEPVLRKHCEKTVSSNRTAHCFTRRDKRRWTMAVCKGKVTDTPLKLK
ncbi:protein BTN1 [Nematostella vectensis]|uniref:protein BTN1 n=1 Tax=Nematostella vectensis TaxID=45351 RepID=UPI002076E9D6|nr:protein BTN1 [Nematostella vectensis]